VRVEIDGIAYGLSPYGGLISYWNETIPRLAEHFDLRLTLPTTLRATPPRIAGPNKGWQPDVCISTYFTQPNSQSPAVLVVHDLIYEDGFLSPTAAGDLVSICAKHACIEAAAQIVVPSHATFDRLSHHYPEAAARTRVIWHGVDDTLRQAPDELTMTQVDRLLGEAGVRHPFILHVGGRTGYKNIATLMEAVDYLQPHWPNLKLVSVGDQVPVVDNDGMNRGDHGVSLGFVPRPILSGLYRRAAATASASLVEGFGLPIAEAQALGCPIVCSHIPAYREIAGNDAHFFPPHDARLAADAITHALRSPRSPPTWERTWDESTIELRTLV
jgi:glycosyltransferase involved in cell wall biosynthesis